MTLLRCSRVGCDRIGTYHPVFIVDGQRLVQTVAVCKPHKNELTVGDFPSDVPMKLKWQRVSHRGAAPITYPRPRKEWSDADTERNA